MGKNIKVTERQYRIIQEAIDNTFAYIDEKDTIPYDGQKNISADGKIDGETNGDVTIGDKVSKTVTPQSFLRYRGIGYGRFQPYTMQPNMVDSDMQCDEGIQPNNDKNNDGIDDFYNNDELDLLGDDDADNDLVKIPQGIVTKSDILIDAVNSNNLTSKQQAIILNKIIEAFDITSIPYAWKKELILKLKQ